MRNHCTGQPAITRGTAAANSKPIDAQRTAFIPAGTFNAR
jgi:hypothetical protein